MFFELRASEQFVLTIFELKALRKLILKILKFDYFYLLVIFWIEGIETIWVQEIVNIDNFWYFWIETIGTIWVVNIGNK